MTAAGEFPTVEATPSKDGRTCTVRCPFCRRTHTHGLGQDRATYGHRVAHCTTGSAGGYVVVPAPPR